MKPVVFKITSQKRHPRWLISLAAIGVCLAGAGMAGGAEVVLRAVSTCRGGVVRVEDVAEVRSDDSNEAAALRAIELTPAPAEGETRIIRGREIAELLSLYGVDPKRVHVGGASQTTVRTSGTGATPRAAAALQDSPRATAETKDGDVKIPPRRELMKTSAAVPVAASTPAAAQVRDALAAARNIPEQVVAAVRPLKRGEVLRAADLKLVSAEELATVQQPIARLDQAVGQEVQRPIAAGQPLEVSAVRLPLLVRRGEPVTVVSRGDGISIRTMGVAMEDGGQGELVNIQPPADRKQKYTARVVDWQTVEVLSGASVAREEPVKGVKR